MCLDVNAARRVGEKLEGPAAAPDAVGKQNQPREHNNKQEYVKCASDPVYFMKKYMLS